MSQEEVVDITRTLLGHLSTHPLAKVSCKPPPLLVHFLTTFSPQKFQLTALVYLGVFDDAGSLRGRRLHMIPSFQRLVIEDFEEIEKKVQSATSEICARSEDLELVGKAINISHGFLFYKNTLLQGAGGV